MTATIKVGVSACLLGQPVRYDGGHKHDRYITETLGAFFSFVPVCPEVECGMTVPREPMRLEGDPCNPRLITNYSRSDLTEQMLDYCCAKVRRLEQEELCGFIFKKDSPSCGLLQVKVYAGDESAKNGSGLFAAAMQRTFPLLPMEEEGRLHDPAIREIFLKRLFCYHRLQGFLGNTPPVELLHNHV